MNTVESEKEKGKVIRTQCYVIPESQSPLTELEQIKSETPITPDQPLIKCDLSHKPEIHPKFASVLPLDSVAYQLHEQQICRGDCAPVLDVCHMDGKVYLLHDHMLMDIIIKNEIDEFYLRAVKDIDTIDKGIWWIVEKSNSLPHYIMYVQLDIILDHIHIFEKLAKENMRLGGKLKKILFKEKGFRPIDCLSLIAKKVGCSRELVNEVKYIRKHGTAKEKEKCRKGAAITTVYKEVKKRKSNSPDKNAAHDNVKFNNSAEGTYIDMVHQGDNVEKIKEMQFNGVRDIAAIITSNNYNVGKDYGPDHDDSLPHDQFIENLGTVAYEGQKLGRPGMRLIFVFPQTTNKNSKSGEDYRYSLLADVIYKIKELNAKYDDCSLRFWGHFDWFKNHAGGNVCQGSISASCPVLRPDAEYIAVWVKEDKKLENIHGVDFKPKKPNALTESDRDKYIITPEEYYKWTLQTWQIPPVTDSKYRHPARCPEELVHRLIKLFTYPQDIVLDPYCGSGTSLVAAKKLKRHYIGIDQNPAYCQMSKDRLAELDEWKDGHE